MKTLDDEIAIVLTNRHYIYELLQHIWGNEPSLKLLEITSSEHTIEAIRLLKNEDSQFIDIETLFEKVKNEILSNPVDFLDRLRTEYTCLMIGPNKLPAPPWESVYLTKERLIFQESTLLVRRAYLKYQVLPANYPHEADDHLALELYFMLHLAKLSMEAFEEGSIEEVKKLLTDQKLFLEEHLLVWIDQFADQIQNSKTHYFYPKIAVLTKELVRIDADVIDELLSLLV